MSKTTSLEINCASANCSVNNNRVINVVIDQPDDIDGILSQIDNDELIQYVARNLTPEDIFSSKDLANWAESEGYTKE